ncbi:transcriptional regulator, AraC family (plasmid) [Fibrella aestuarina BUZ 2]|uniref:Transcriptional regulator, AraC family n=1 Tax=Fibrella aestuarina BUZ 2 TaxID=1166018 RepID=I0KHJ8_9BACT|nr:AraC family transcriptional regulator [Fibrella aestuarina]CCH03601.1 transcriptional regulator, AraC family [Fibrella aestuarina BUZ 2]
MNNTTLRIRDMVCGRCVDTVRTELTRLGYAVTEVGLGSATIAGELTETQLDTIRRVLEEQGFSLLTDRRAMLVNQVKTLIEQTLNREDLGETKWRFSDLIQQAFSLDYDTISSLFSQAEGITLEKYIISKRLDKVKEKLVYTDLTLADIAYQTGYSSVAHLSNQFKQQIGLTPSYFRKVRQEKLELQQQHVATD